MNITLLAGYPQYMVTIFQIEVGPIAWVGLVDGSQQGLGLFPILYIGFKHLYSHTFKIKILYGQLRSVIATNWGGIATGFPAKVKEEVGKAGGVSLPF